MKKIYLLTALTFTGPALLWAQALVLPADGTVVKVISAEFILNVEKAVAGGAQKYQTEKQVALAQRIITSGDWLQAMGDFMQMCDHNYKPTSSAPQDVLNYVSNFEQRPNLQTDSCVAKRIAIQNELAAQYYSPHLRYTPMQQVDNSKEIAFLKKVYAKVMSYFYISPESVENARKSILGKRAGLYFEPKAGALPDSTTHKK